MLLYANGTHYDQIYREQGDLAVVVQQPIKGEGPSIVTKELYKFLLPIVPRLNGVYVVHATYPGFDKSPSMRELRAGWARVLAHIAVTGPNVKRVLLMGSTALLRVAVPALNKKQEHGTRPDLQDCHGTIFTLPQFQLVPTWQMEDYALRHMQPWMDRDLLRFEKLTKPATPLPYTKEIPTWLLSQFYENREMITAFVQTAVSMNWLPTENDVAFALKLLQNGPENIPQLQTTMLTECEAFAVSLLKHMVTSVSAATKQFMSSWSSITSTMTEHWNEITAVKAVVIQSLLISCMPYFQNSDQTYKSYAGTVMQPSNTTVHVPTCVVDLETGGLEENSDLITSYGLQWTEQDRCILYGVHGAVALTCLAFSKTQTVGHNLSFDLGFMGNQFRKGTRGRIRDTLIRARARGELVGGLKHLGAVFTARPGNFAWISDEAHSFDDPAYVCEDLDVTWRLYKLWPETTPVIEVMERAVTMVACQTAAGTKIDTIAAESLVHDVQEQVAELREELLERYGCDPNQVEILGIKLLEMGYVLSKKTQKGKNALTAEVLEELGLVDILEYRKAQKLDSAFVGKIRGLCREDGTIPHHQGLLNARTGRTTMRDFNWQQMPKKGPGKRLAVSRWEGGQIWNCDLKSAEVFTACYLSQDRQLAEALRGPDMHRANAARGFNKDAELITDDERFQAKALIFRSIFGGGPQNEQQKRVHSYMTGEFRKLFEWIDAQKKKGQNELRVVDILGKVTNMLDKFDYAGKWACGRLGINAPVQGTSSHIAIALTVRLWELFLERGLQSLVLFGVHDSFVADIHPDEFVQAEECIVQAFKDVGKWVAQYLPMIKELPLLGELTKGINWAACKDSPIRICSTRGADV